MKHINKYTSASHIYWLEEHNCGVSHYGIHPDHMRYKCILIYVFHPGSTKTRHTLKYLQIFMRCQTVQLTVSIYIYDKA